MSTATVAGSPAVVCPSWCQGHTIETDSNGVHALHYTPMFGSIDGTIGLNADGTVFEELGMIVRDEYGMSAADLRQLAADALAAAEWLEKLTHPLASRVSEVFGPAAEGWHAGQSGLFVYKKRQPLFVQTPKRTHLFEGGAVRTSDGTAFASTYCGKVEWPGFSIVEDVTLPMCETCARSMA